MKLNVLFILSTLVLISCNSDIDNTFNELIDIRNSNYENILLSNDYCLKNIDNKYYKILYKKGKTINKYLLEKACSEKETNWYSYPVYFYMVEGNIAIELLLDINNLDIKKIIPKDLVDEYDTNGLYAFWDYTYKNRKEIIELIKENI